MENNLKNLKCPNCKAQQVFMIDVTCKVEVADTKVFNPTDVKWEETSKIMCKSCYCQGTVDAFTVKRGRKK